MVEKYREAHASEWAVLQSVASKLGCTSETLRKWVRQALGPCVSFPISPVIVKDSLAVIAPAETAISRPTATAIRCDRPR